MLCGFVPVPQQARYSVIRGRGGNVIDRGIVLFFAGPRSYTGEDSAELHLHGGRAVVARMLAELSAFDGFRPADAGEFTLRAFLNGKIDLTEAEALSDLIAADTEEQRRFAMVNASGGHRERYEEWRRRIVEIMAVVEASIDFVDEEDAPEDVGALVWNAADELAKEIESHCRLYRTGEIIRDGYKVVILGAPNAGKSSLLNALAGRDVAIVTDEPGTTRDVIEVDLDLGGLLVKVSDTAGIRVGEGKAETIGIERSIRAAGFADMVILLEDIAAPAGLQVPDTEAQVIHVGNKADIGATLGSGNYDVLISARTGEGLDRLLGLIEGAARARTVRVELIPFRERHVALMERGVSALRRAAGDSNSALEIRAEELRQAADHLGRITGAVDVEDLLDVIFSRFCIGK